MQSECKDYCSTMGNTIRRALLGLPGPIMITGHTGFKGVWMTLLLERLGVDVVGLSLPPKEDSLYAKLNRVGKIKESFTDIRNYEGVLAFVEQVNPSVIFHFAAQPLVLDSFNHPRETFEINAMGTVNILDIAQSSKTINIVILATTDKVYRNDNSGKLFSEDDALGGQDPYSASKVGAEAAIKAWQELSSFHGKPKIISVRSGNVIGGGDMAENRLLPDMAKSLINQESIFLRNPDSTRPWQHVLDPLHGYLLVLAKAIDGECSDAYNFGPTSKSIPVYEVAKIALKVWKSDQLIKVLPQLEDAKKEANILNLNSDKARGHLGWKSVWSQRESIESTIKWWHKVSIQKVDIKSACESDIDKLFVALKWDDPEAR